jgi:hypothetical protein
MICSLFFICLRRFPIRAWQFPLLYFADPRVDDPRRARRGPRHCELPAVLQAICPVLLRIGGSPPNRNLLLLLCLSEVVVLRSGTLTNYFNCSAFPVLKQYICVVIFEAMSNPVHQAQYMEHSSTRPTSSTEHWSPPLRPSGAATRHRVRHHHLRRRGCAWSEEPVSRCDKARKTHLTFFCVRAQPRLPSRGRGNGNNQRIARRASNIEINLLKT